jgi:hypothetical protein
MATHNPIVAAQFAPGERLVLRWEDGNVVASKGQTPQGDDPNDILRTDFDLTNLMGPAGRAAWDEYLALLSRARHAQSTDEKLEAAARASELGARYQFGGTSP